MNTKTLLNTDSQLTVLLYNFDVGSPHLKPEHITYLMNVVKPRLSANLGGMVIGMTSRTGSDGLNSHLSRARADSVLKQIRKANPSLPLDALEIGLGEEAARAAGLKDGTEDGRWRAVLLMLTDGTMEQPRGRYYDRAWIYDASEDIFRGMVSANDNPNTYLVPIQATQGSALMVLRDWLDELVKNGTRFGSLVFITHGGAGVIRLDGDDLAVRQWNLYYSGRGYEKLLPRFGNVYFAGCDCAADEAGWQFLEAAGKIFLTGSGGICFGWTSLGFAVPSWFRFSAGHAVHLWGDIRNVVIGPGGNVTGRFTV